MEPKSKSDEAPEAGMDFEAMLDLIAESAPLQEGQLDLGELAQMMGLGNNPQVMAQLPQFQEMFNQIMPASNGKSKKGGSKKEGSITMDPTVDFVPMMSKPKIPVAETDSEDESYYESPSSPLPKTGVYHKLQHHFHNYLQEPPAEASPKLSSKLSSEPQGLVESDEEEEIPLSMLKEEISAPPVAPPTSAELSAPAEEEPSGLDLLISDELKMSKEEEEMQMALALIAQMEECEKKGEVYIPPEDPSSMMAPATSGETETIQLPDGCIYMGTIDGNRAPHGNGVLMDDTFTRTIYEGQYHHGYKEGYGTFHYSDGGTYVGMFQKENPHGHGEYHLNGKMVYEGEYDQGIAKGLGTVYRGNGTKYVGEHLEMRAQGQGTLYNKEGDLMYEGTFHTDTYHGHGKIYLEGGAWNGEFNYGTMNGVYESVDGYRKITAEFVNGALTKILSEEVIKMSPEEEQKMERMAYDFYTGNEFEVVI